VPWRTRKKNSRITQALDKEEEVSSPLLYRISRAELTFAQDGAITEERYAEVEARLKTAIAKKAHQLFASPSFPSELRLQVMKAGVLQSTSWWQVRRDHTVDYIWSAAFSSLLPPELWNPKRERFDTSWLDAETRRCLANIAKQAFLGTAIIKYQAGFRDPGWEGDIPSFKLPPLLASVGARIHHLDLFIRVRTNSFARPQNGYYTRMAIRCMDSLKLHFPNLKACVLTLDVHFRVCGPFLAMAMHGSPLAQFDERLLQMITASPHSEDRGIKTLRDEITKLFEEFVAVGPGKRKFVRIRFRSILNDSLRGGQEAEKHFTYGPLVRAERVDGDGASLGARLLNAAYRLERTGPRLLSQEPLR
jgi:hypothetical protein